MRRAAALVLGALAGTGLLVGAKIGNASTGPAAAGDGGASGVTVTGPNVTTTTASSGATQAGVPSGTTAGIGATPGGNTSTTHSPMPGTPPKSGTPTPGKTSVKPTPTPAQAPTASGPKDGTYQASSTEHYGTLTLTVTISGHKITDIAANYASNSPSYCTKKACPTLRSEALTAQSAKIATVSGATYTSDAYIAALAAVLKSAG